MSPLKSVVFKGSCAPRWHILVPTKCAVFVNMTPTKLRVGHANLVSLQPTRGHFWQHACQISSAPMRKYCLVCALAMLIGCSGPAPKGEVVDDIWYVPPVGQVTCEMMGYRGDGEIIEEYTEESGDIIFYWEGFWYRLIIEDAGMEVPSNPSVVELGLKANFYQVILPHVLEGEPGGVLIEERPDTVDGKTVYFGLLSYKERQRGHRSRSGNWEPIYTGIVSYAQGRFIYTITKNMPMWYGMDGQQDRRDSMFAETLKYFRKCEFGTIRQPTPTCYTTGGRQEPVIKDYPMYPEIAAHQCLEGDVRVKMHVRPNGTVSGASVEGANPPKIFDKSTLDAVGNWQFLKLCHGEPEAMRTFTTTVEFRLTEDDKAACAIVSPTN